MNDVKMYDALKVLNISETTITLEIIKKAFHAAAKTYHPDINPAGLEMMKMVTSANEILMARSLPFDIKFSNGTDYGGEVNDALNKIINFEELDIEVCGSWIWVGGNSKPFKEHLKAAGFKWSRKKTKWYFSPSYGKSKYKNRKEYSMNEIRERHGSNRVETNRVNRIA